MPTLKNIVEKSDTTAGLIFDLVVQSLIFVSLITFSLETLPGLSTETQQVLYGVEVFTVAIFTLEYLLRLFVADHKFRFVFSFFGIIDLLAILPFYASLGVDLRSMRAFRMLRLFRILKLTRYSTAIRRFHLALMIAREEIILFLSATLLLLYLSSVGIYYFENPAQPDKFQSVFHSMWWSVATLTTVGYGDVYPVTTGGRIFTFFILLIGLGIVSVPAGLVSAALQKAREIEKQEKLKPDTTDENRD